MTCSMMTIGTSDMKVPSSTVRNDFTDLMNRVVQSGEVIEVQKYGTTQLVMISKERYERLTRDLMRDD